MELKRALRIFILETIVNYYKDNITNNYNCQQKLNVKCKLLHLLK